MEHIWKNVIFSYIFISFSFFETCRNQVALKNHSLDSKEEGKGKWSYANETKYFIKIMNEIGLKLIGKRLPSSYLLKLLTAEVENFTWNGLTRVPMCILVFACVFLSKIQWNLNFDPKFQMKIIMKLHSYLLLFKITYFHESWNDCCYESTNSIDKTPVPFLNNIGGNKSPG